MRKWAYLKEPYYTSQSDTVYKIMVHEQKECTLVYLLLRQGRCHVFV